MVTLASPVGHPPSLAAFRLDGRAAGPVDGAVHPAPGTQGGIGGVDYGLRVLPGDIPFHQLQG